MNLYEIFLALLGGVAFAAMAVAIMYLAVFF